LDGFGGGTVYKQHAWTLIRTVEEAPRLGASFDHLKRPAAWLRQAGVTDDRRDLKTGIEGSIGLRIPTIARHARAVRRGPVVDDIGDC